MKYAKLTGNVRWSGGLTQLRRGMSADDNHPLVLQRPDLFGDEPPEAELKGPPVNDQPQEREEPAGPVVERATAAPGEKRTLGRASRRKAAPKGGEASE